MSRPRKVSYELVPRDSILGHPVYALLDGLIEQHHTELRQARVAIAWCRAWKADVDGRILLGRCTKASDLDRELASWDVVILLARWFWESPEVTDRQRVALLDHELCHAAVRCDPSGEPLEDERGRRVYRLRRHDIEEFAAIVERHGTYRHELESFAAALRRSAAAAETAFTPCPVCEQSPSWVAILDSAGAPRTTRCACWLAWSQRRKEMSVA